VIKGEDGDTPGLAACLQWCRRYRISTVYGRNTGLL